MIFHNTTKLLYSINIFYLNVYYFHSNRKYLSEIYFNLFFDCQRFMLLFNNHRSKFQVVNVFEMIMI